jgi:hypothetical protein
MTTVGANFVSTNFLANSLVRPVMQAQSQLTSAMIEESTGQYADLGLQLGDQSGYELSLKEQVGQLQALTTGNSVVSTNLSTAQNALSAIQKKCTNDAQQSRSMDAEWHVRRFASEHGSIGPTIADQRGQHDVGRSICFRWNQFRRRADERLLFNPGVCHEDRS